MHYRKFTGLIAGLLVFLAAAGALHAQVLTVTNGLQLWPINRLTAITPSKPAMFRPRSSSPARKTANPRCASTASPTFWMSPVRRVLPLRGIFPPSSS